MAMLSNSKNWYERIKFHRLNNDMTQKDLADEIGAGLRTVQRWEYGESKPYPSIREKIATALKTTVEDIFEQKEAAADED